MAPAGQRLKYNPYGCWLEMDKTKCCSQCIVKSIHAPLISCMSCHCLVHCCCVWDLVLAKHKLEHPNKEERGQHFEYFEDGVCSKMCYDKAAKLVRQERFKKLQYNCLGTVMVAKR